MLFIQKKVKKKKKRAKNPTWLLNLPIQLGINTSHYDWILDRHLENVFKWKPIALPWCASISSMASINESSSTSYSTLSTNASIGAL